MKRVIFDDNSEVVNDWIGKIPNQWQVKRLKFVSNFISGYSFKADEFTDNGIPVIRIGDIKERIDLVDCKYWDELEFESLKAFEVKKDDILVALTGATIGKSTLYDIESPALLNQRCAILRPQKIIENIFLKHFIKTDIFREYINLECNGGAQGNIGKPEVGNFLMCLPPLPEQQIIAAFLDYKTKQIDDLIAKKEQLLRLLEEKRIALITQAVTKGLDPNVKMKPSGIEWLGDIPEHWEVKRLKFISKIQFSNVDKKTEENENEVLLCNYVDVYNNDFIDSKLDFMKATATEREIERFLVQKGDVIATKDSETPFDIAVPALVIEELNGVLCGYHLAQIKPNQDILLPEYLFRLFQAVNFNTHFIVRANGVTRFGIGTDAFDDATVPIISKDEQKKIVEYIQNSCHKIDSLQKSITVAIEKLKEYRTSLITSAVTGKIDVRDFKPPREE